MADKTENTRFGSTSKAIAQDFAEQLKYSLDADVYHTTTEGRYQALAFAIRDRIIHQWDLSRKTQRAKHSKRVYYLSLEFLMGRAMTNNIINMGLEKGVKDALSSLGYEYEDLADVEPDAGLGNGGLGRLAACFLDSLATLELPAYGYGIRYNYGAIPGKSRDRISYIQCSSEEKSGKAARTAGISSHGFLMRQSMASLMIPR